MRALPFFLLFFYHTFLSFQPVQAQAVIEGTILLADTEEPALGAYVHLVELERAAIADIKGAFRLTDIPRGTYTLEASFLGYQTLLEAITIESVDQRVQVQLALTPKAHEIEGVVVSGGYATTQDENAIKIEKLESAELTRATHYLEALSRLPGVDNLSRGPGIGKPVIRGLSNNQILVLNHGVRNENFQYSGNHPIGLDEWGIERIEVIKGPASLLYGSGAIGGVVNLLKERPAAPGQVLGDVLMQYHGNTQGVSGTAGVRAGGEHFFGGARVGVKNHADYVDGEGNFVPNTRFNTLALRGHAGYRGDKWVSRIYYDFDRQRLGMFSGFTKAYIEERGRALDVWYQDLDNHLLNWQNTFVFDHFQLKANIAWQGNHRRLQNPRQSPEQAKLGAAIDMFMRTLSYDVKGIYRRDASTRFILGFQGLAGAITNDDEARAVILPKGWMNDYGLYGLAQHQVSSRFNTQLGARFDLRDIRTELTNEGQPAEKPAVEGQFSNYSASLGATYEIAPNWLLRANAASGFRAPNFIELSANGLHGSRWERGDAGLTPERSYEFDLSGHYHGRRLTLELAAFYNRVNNYIFLQPTAEAAPAGGGVVFAYRQDDSRLYGLEAGFHLHPPAWDWLHLASTFSWVYGEQDNGDYLPFIPAKRWNNEVGVQGDVNGWLSAGFLRLSVDHAFRQSNPAPFELATDGYTLLGLRLGGTLELAGRSVEARLSANNLLDVAYFNHLSTLRPLEVLDPGRNVVLTLRLPFGKE